ncbi:CBS domain-containing protein [Rheinheimera marina]|uniref:CBS domain-containing protein n=1 Tax=Rheinheimera marina TaxID=1774958 RepID=A0ABV9JLW6_9GAMM
MQVAAIMSRKLVTVGPDASLAQIRVIFETAKFQHLPVLDSSKRLVGIVSVKDYFKALSPVMETASEPTLELFLSSRRVKYLMTSPVITVTEDYPVVQAAALLLKHNISCLPVVDKDQIALGIVSWKDIMRVVVLQSSKRARLNYGPRGEEE